MVTSNQLSLTKFFGHTKKRLCTRRTSSRATRGIRGSPQLGWGRVSTDKRFEKVQQKTATGRCSSLQNRFAVCLFPPRGCASIGIDKKSKSNSFFCFSLYTDKVGVFMKSLSVCLSVCVSSTIRICRTRMWLDTFVRGTVITEKHLKYSH